MSTENEPNSEHGEDFHADTTGGGLVPQPSEAAPPSPEASPEQNLFGAVKAKMERARGLKTDALMTFVGAGSLSIVLHDTAESLPTWGKAAIVAAEAAMAGVSVGAGLLARQNRRDAERFVDQGAAGNYDLPPGTKIAPPEAEK